MEFFQEKFTLQEGHNLDVPKIFEANIFVPLAPVFDDSLLTLALYVFCNFLAHVFQRGQEII